MYTNAQHPHFNLAMELLVCIPVSPSYVTVQDLVEDLGFRLQADVRDLIAQLVRQGYWLVVENKGEGRGRVVFCRPGPLADKTRAIAKAYLADVYPGGSLVGDLAFVRRPDGRGVLEHPVAKCSQNDHNPPQSRSFLTARQRAT